MSSCRNKKNSNFRSTHLIICPPPASELERAPPSSSSSASTSFTRRVFDLTSAITSRVHPAGGGATAACAHGEGGGCCRCTHARVALPVGAGAAPPSCKPPLTKTRSLEKDFEFRVNPAAAAAAPPRRRVGWCSRKENQRRTRSLERNHRYLVTLDASCRWVVVVLLFFLP